MSLSDEQDRIVVAKVRSSTGIPESRGPSDGSIALAAREYAEKFTYWYTRVVREASSKYRRVIVDRINPFTKQIECEGLSSEETALHLVEIYSNRNFATAGGWAIEALAIAISGGQKSSATGIDLEVQDSRGNRNLYVFKSSPVTRNSDILSALKANARQAEKLIRQSNSRTLVDPVYAVAFGVRKSTYEDGVRRPSSIELWCELTGLEDPDEAAAMVLSVAREGYREFAKESAGRSLGVLRMLVGRYNAADSADVSIQPTRDLAVDWDFLALRNMSEREVWKAEDLARHRRAVQDVEASGWISGLAVG